MEQPLPQRLSTNSVPRAFFPRVAIGCRLSLKIDGNLSPFWAGAYPWLRRVTRWGNWWCHRIFSSKSDDFFLVIVLWKVMTFFSYRLVTTPTLSAFQRRFSSVLYKLFHSGVTPPPWSVSPGVGTPTLKSWLRHCFRCSLINQSIFICLNKQIQRDSS